jgi:sorbitol-6-phosphate 2-dehydrogenase
MRYISLSPIIRGLTSDGEKGLIVQHKEEYDGECPLLVLPEDADESSSAALIKELLFDASGKVVPALRIKGAGCFLMGRNLSDVGTRAIGLKTFSGRRDEVAAGKVAVVTGGAQGFGETLVRGLFAAGAVVAVADLNRAGAQKLTEELNSGAGETRAFACTVNVADEESVAKMIDQVVGTAGGIDLYLSNAGVLKAGSVKTLSLTDFRFVTDVNYTGYFLGVKYASPIMARQNGAAEGAYYTDIVQINSKSGLEGSNRNGAYAGGKFGGIGLSQSFALELIEDNIKVNSICPGNFFDGPLWSDPRKGLFVQYLKAGKVPEAKSIADVRRYYEARVPMGRGCEGGDVLRALFYIMEQKYETGQAVPVTGGQVMLH